MKKKKKKVKINWGLIALIFVLAFVLISSYGLFKLYDDLRTSTTVMPPTNSDEVDSDVEEDIDHIQFYQLRLEEMQNRIRKTDASLINVLQEMRLTVTTENSEAKKVEIYDDFYLNWQMKKEAIQVVEGIEYLNTVKSAFEMAAKQVGSELIREEESESKGKLTKVLYFGFLEDETEIITNQLSLTAIPFKVKAKLAFIIDDLGYEWREFERMMTIPRPMTFAVIPHLPKSVYHAQRVWAEGYDLIMHQPMEPASAQNPGDSAIYTRMTEDEIIQTLAENLASLPQGLIGVNNHMGSKATADRRVMEVVLRFLRERGMFFIDSSTAPNSVVATVAKQVGERYAENRIFIDNVDELDKIKEQIMKAARIALRDGQAITIGHVRKYTAQAILESIDVLEGMGVQIVYAKELLHRP